MDDAIYCWGNNDRKQLGAPVGRFKQVMSGDDFSCGMRSNGSVECWGQMFFPPATH